MGEKYVIFKYEDFHSWAAEFDQDCPEMVRDAVVIRRQDIFAAPALDAYANSILIAAEILGEGSDDYPRLLDTANFFHDQASRSWQTPNRKLPD